MKKLFPLFVIGFFFTTLLLTPLLVHNNKILDSQTELLSNTTPHKPIQIAGFEPIEFRSGNGHKLQLWRIERIDDYPPRLIVCVRYRENLPDRGLSILKSEVERFAINGKSNIQLDGSAYSLRFEGGNPIWFPFYSDIHGHGHFTCLTFALKWRMETNNVIVATGDDTQSFSEYDLQPKEVITVSSQNK